ncbi:hypothetical protein DICSQDRAFT_157138 [Dichomitus squalens LYAD-421 SS1]|uniref:Uncharacterized protein n=1 Tax=Dichomitus squalens (strain LYAD-421) TaxID=732165 RepID=R7SNQ0_DICSQ|nr:uncharacterized protein DICSQDRAFT_157138 [Dichomitus squalens LYAD-421 SS1]EJF57819.1 hypothetical protein DICSQDRAFT_157138 [Dichomitus squalens LYAD-421 SS1]
MATLRAHVRKMADARKDKMGPQWSQWVTRAVHKLADDGILDTHDAQGNVAFTPDAKKTITAIRRDSLGPGVVPSANLEQKIWKDVTRRFSTVGVKRPRRMSGAAGHADEDGGEGRPRKRRARKSLSSFTKAELEAELRAALQQLEESEEADSAEQEDVVALREELKLREQEVDELRDEVARLKTQSEHDARRVTIGTSMRLVTPPPTERLAPSSAGSGRPATTYRVGAPMHGVTRTLSGSLISNLTRRPTPEPSEPGSQYAEIEGLVFDDVQDDDDFSSLSSVHGHDDAVSDFTPRKVGLETSQSTSNLMAHDMESATKHHETDAHIEEIAALKKELQAHVMQLSQVRGEHQRLLEERDSLRSSAASRELQLADLTAQLQSRTATLQDTQSLLVKLEATLQTERTEGIDVRSALQISQAALEAERERTRSLETRHSSVQEELSSAQSALKTLQQTMETFESSHDQTRSELQQTKTLLASAQRELAEALRAIEAGVVSQQTLTDHARGLELYLKQYLAQTSALVADKENLERTAEALRDTVDQLRTDLTRAEDDVASTTTRLKQSQDVIDELRASREQAQLDAAASTREATSLKVTVSELESSLGSLRFQLEDSLAETARLRGQLEAEQSSRRTVESVLSATKASHDKLVSEMAEKALRMTSVEEELNQTRRALDDTRCQVEVLKKEHERDAAAHAEALEAARVKAADFRIQLDGLRSQITSLSGELRSVSSAKDSLSTRLEEEVARSAQLQEDLAIARDDVQDAEEEILELREAKAADEASIQSLKAGLARLRQLQMDALDEVDNKMVSAHSAPIPGHRRRSSIASRQSIGQRA